MSCVGVMFAPHHQASADELVRVCRPGGTIGLLSWTPEGFIGQMFATMKPYAPPPPPGAQPPPLWGDEQHVRALLGDRVTDVVARRQTREGRPVRDSGGVPRLLQGRLRPDDRGLPRHRRRPEQVAALDAALAELRSTRLDRGAATTSWSGSTCCSPPAGRADTGAWHRGLDGVQSA